MFEHLLADLAAEARAAMATDMFKGAAGAGLLLGLVGAVGYQLRALPGHVLRLLQSQFTVTLTVHNDASAFTALALWLSRHEDLAKARRLTVAQWWSRAHDRLDFALTAGPGRHLLRHQGRWLLLHRDSAPAAQQQGVTQGGAGRNETLTFTTLGRSQAPFRALIAEASAVEEDGDCITIHSHGSGPIGRRAKRSMDTLYLDAKLKAEILATVERFMASRQWYADRGIPWRLGIMLTGAPGTGKSTLIFAIASLLNKPVHIVNPSTIPSDSGLLYALNSNVGAIVCIEDIDSVEILKARPNLRLVAEQAARRSNAGGETSAQGSDNAQPAVASAAPPTQPGKAGEGLTLSGFLNAIDGVGAHEGRILFVTSNTPEALDPALMRPGRVDRRYELGPAGVAEARAMFARFFPEGDADAFARTIASRLPMAQAELQDLLLTLVDAENPVHALQAELEQRLAA